MLTLSPISYGRRTKINRMPSKYFEEAGPNTELEKERDVSELVRVGVKTKHTVGVRYLLNENENKALFC